MSNFDDWVIARTAIGTIADTDLIPIIDDPAGTASTKKVAVDDLRTYMQEGVASTVVESSAQTAAYTLVLGDAGKAVTLTVAGAHNLTVPPNSSVAFPVGTVVGVEQLGAGTTTIAPGSGVTLRSRGNLLSLAGQYAVASLRKIGTDEWIVTGDLA